MVPPNANEKVGDCYRHKSPVVMSAHLLELMYKNQRTDSVPARKTAIRKYVTSSESPIGGAPCWTASSTYRFTAIPLTAYRVTNSETAGRYKHARVKDVFRFRRSFPKNVAAIYANEMVSQYSNCRCASSRRVRATSKSSKADTVS